MTTVNDVPAIDPAALADVVDRATGGRGVPVSDWNVTALVGGAGIGAGTYRVAGTGGAATTPWSVVLKVLTRAGGSDDPLRWDAWRREPAAYRSGLLDTLPPGLAAARCHGVIDVDADTTWIWLEDLGEDARGTWTIEDHVAVADGFGELAGRRLGASSLPDSPWLSRRWLHGWVEANADAMTVFAGALDHPWVRRVWPEGEAAEMLALWQAREPRIAVLDRLPATLCHFDVFRRNLHTRIAPTGAVTVTVLDWAFVGTGAPGEDLVPMVLGNLAFGELPPLDAMALEERALAAYVGGMRRAGWDGDPRSVELAYAVAGAHRYSVGVMRLFLPFLIGEAPEAVAEQIFGMPFHTIAEATGIVTSRHALRLARVADRLTSELGLG